MTTDADVETWQERLERERVERRLLPDAQCGLDMARKANADSDTYTSKRNANLAAVLGRALNESEAKDGKACLDERDISVISRGHVRAGADDVALELYGVPVDVAVKVMALLRKGSKGRL